MEEWGLPSEREVERALFRYLAARRQPVEPASVYGPLADVFKLTAAQRTASRDDNGPPAWSGCVRAAQASLRQKGLLLAETGVWGLSEYGRQIAQARPA